MFVRFEELIGKEKFNEITKLNIMIIGLGGVGGHAITALVRCGIENIIICDFDVVDQTNINRQIIAYNSTIGNKKVDVMEDVLLDINPNCNITKISDKITPENLGNVLDNKRIDYIIDACDDIKVKKELILECIKRKIKLISSMGTGNKFNPSMLEITDIRKTVNDPLARIMRKWVKDNRIKEKIPVVSSKEVPVKTSGKVLSNSFVPASAGLLIASFIVNETISKKDA